MKSQELTIDSPADRIEVLKAIEELPEEEKWTVKISPFDDNRSGGQRRLNWLWNTEIGSYYGYTPEEMHEYFKKRYLINIKAKDDDFLAIVRAVNTYDPESEEYQKAATALAREITTTNLRWKPMSEFLSRIKQFALHEGIPITIPKQDELDWLLGIKRNKPKKTEI
jgi:hypothetical protein